MTGRSPLLQCPNKTHRYQRACVCVCHLQGSAQTSVTTCIITTRNNLPTPIERPTQRSSQTHFNNILVLFSGVTTRPERLQLGSAMSAMMLRHNCVTSCCGRACLEHVLSTPSGKVMKTNYRYHYVDQFHIVYFHSTQ